MATQTQDTAKRTADPAQNPWAVWMHSQDSLLDYWEDVSKLYTEALERSLRAMLPVTGMNVANKGGADNGLSELINTMERSRELLFIQIESMGAFQSALWEPWFKQLSTGPASPPAGNTRRKGGPSA